MLGVCPKIRNHLRPNYSIPVQEVYTSFARARIVAEGNLSTLATAGLAVGHHREHLGLPSWVPDLRSADLVDVRYLTGIFLRRFAAAPAMRSGASVLELSETGTSTILKINAYLLDSVTVKTDLADLGRKGQKAVLVNMWGGNTSVAEVRQFFRTIIFEDASFYGQVDNAFVTQELRAGLYQDIETRVRNEVGWVRWSLVRQYVKERQKVRLERLILGFIQEYLYCLESEEGFLAALLDSFEDIGLYLRRGPVCDPLRNYEADDLHLYRCDFMARANKVSGKDISAICKTEGGRIGNGPRNIEAGDIIALAVGCQVPLVLRQVGPFYRLVGPCYIAGIMQGEAISSCKGTSRSVYLL